MDANEFSIVLLHANFVLGKGEGADLVHACGCPNTGDVPSPEEMQDIPKQMQGKVHLCDVVAPAMEHRK